MTLTKILFPRLFAILLIVNKVLSGCPLFLTISLNETEVEDSFLEINWGPVCLYKPQTISIFKDDPTLSTDSSLLTVFNITKGISGKFTTTIKVGNLKFPGGWNKNSQTNFNISTFGRGKCLNYYIAAFNSTELLTMDCVKIYPNWMSESKYVNELPLKELFIPGTHSSGSYNYEKKNAKASNYLVLKDYAFSQSMDVYSQLVFGIRFIDLKIGYNEKLGGKEFWIINENKFIVELNRVLADIRYFLERSRDVVILDFSGFPYGFYKQPKRHVELIDFLQKAVGDIAVSKDIVPEGKHIFDLSVKEITQKGGKLVILYPIEELAYPESESQIIFPILKRFSMEDKGHDDSIDFMSLLFSKRNASLIGDEGWIFYAIQSLSGSFNNDGGQMIPARDRAIKINPKISSLMSGPWSGNANIVALDYFSNTKLVDIAIYSNIQKAFHYINKDFVKFEI